jgi:serine/threonine-protein kinase RsbW
MATRIPMPKIRECWKISLPAQVDAISPAVDQVMAHIREQHHRVRENEFAIETALREGLANAVTHGCKNDAEKFVYLEVTCKQDGSVQILIRDPGEGFDPAKLANPLDQENVLSDHGRGIYLIRHLMDEVEYAAGGREIRMKKS